MWVSSSIRHTICKKFNLAAYEQYNADIIQVSKTKKDTLNRSTVDV